jgi:branched-chain amino acid transport system substrate-binding protein
LKRVPITAAIVAVALAIAGCGGDQSRGGEISGDTLTIYSSLPLQGPYAAHAQAIVNGEKLALRQAGGRVGNFRVNFASRDDATESGFDTPRWSPDRTADNATKAAQDSRTIAYVGEFDSGATAISVPITNEASFVQVSPAATAVGLTKLVPGADKGEPDKFYPSGDRTFARVIPADDVQASAGAAWAKRLGARRVFLVEDKSVEGQGLVQQFSDAAGRLGGMRIVGRKGMDPRADEYRDFVREVARANPDLVYFSGGPESNPVRFWRDLRDELPDVPVMGTGRLLTPDFYRRLGDAAGESYLTSPAQDQSQLPAEGKRFAREYASAFGERPDPYAAYGHASMALLLDAIGRAGDDAGRRGEIVDRVFETEALRSVIGTFSIDDNGDTDLVKIAGYRLRGGQPRFVEDLRGEARG